MSQPEATKPRTPNLPPEQKATIAVAATGIIVNVIPGIPDAAKSNATDLALAIGPTLTFGGVAVRASRAKWLADKGLLVRDDPKTPLNERLASMWRMVGLGVILLTCVVGITAIILWFVLD